MLGGLIRGLIGTVFGVLATVGVIGALLFGSIYLINGGNLNQAATVQFKMMDVGGTGVGVTFGGVPVLVDSAHKGFAAVKKIRCSAAPKSEACVK